MAYDHHKGKSNFDKENPYKQPLESDSAKNYVPKRRGKYKKRTGRVCQGKDPFKVLFWKCRANARPGYMKGNGLARENWLDVDITPESLKKQFIKQGCACYWTGFPIDPEGIFERDNPLAPSLDRLKCDKGYTQDNVVIALRMINLGRTTCPDDKFREIIKKFKAHCKGEKVRNSLIDFMDVDPNKVLIEEMKLDMNEMFDEIYEGRGPEELQDKFDDLFITHDGERPLKDAIQKRREEQGISTGVGEETRED